MARTRSTAVWPVTFAPGTWTLYDPSCPVPTETWRASIVTFAPYSGVPFFARTLPENVAVWADTDAGIVTTKASTAVSQDINRVLFCIALPQHVKGWGLQAYKPTFNCPCSAVRNTPTWALPHQLVSTSLKIPSTSSTNVLRPGWSCASMTSARGQ